MKAHAMKAVVGLIFLTGLAGAPARADDQPLVVVSDTTIDGGAHIWTNPVVVNGATLTIRNATVYLDYIWGCGPRSNVTVCTNNITIVNGTLRVINSTLDSHVWSADMFDSGFRIEGWASTIDVENSVIQHYTHLGTEVPGPARSTITNSALKQGITSLYFWRGAEVDIVGNTFEDDYHAIEFRDTSGVIRGNHFNRSGRYVDEETMVGRAMDVETTTVGEKQFDSTAVIEDNLVENGSWGLLHLNGFASTIRNNVFRDNDLGINIGLIAGDNITHKDAPLLSGNVMDDNETAVHAYISGAPSDGLDTRTLDLRGTQFVNTTCQEIVATQVPDNTSLTVDATNSWWGTPDGPQSHGKKCPATAGDVKVSPWLTSAP